MSLSKAQVEYFREWGFLPTMPVMSTAEAQTLRDELEKHETSLQQPLKGADRMRQHLIFRSLSRLIRSSTILDRVESLIGPNIMVWSTDWWIKEPQSRTYVSWHQDSQYWGLDTTNLVTVWVALSPATSSSGCMKVIPGSHKGPNRKHEDLFDEYNMLTRGQSIPDVDEDQAVDLAVNVGEAAMFAFRLIHSSPPNKTGDRRIGFAIRYLPPDAKQTLADKDSATLVRGEDNFGYFEHEPAPAFDFDPITVAFHQKSDEQRRHLLYKGTSVTKHRT